LKEHGKVILFSPSFLNLPISSFPFDYFIIDFREDEQRFYFQRHVSKHREQFHFILIRHGFETNNGIFFHNEIVDFPSHPTKDEFDMLLLESPFPAPHCFLSLCSYVCCKN
jgi:hypothetical protein